MFRGLLVALACLPLLATGALAGDSDSRRQTYQKVSDALRTGDFETLKQYLSLQPGLTIDVLEQNWDRAQPTFMSIFPSSDDFALVESFEASNGYHYWIVEMNEVEADNKFLKVFKFAASGENRSGWRVSAARQTGSFNHPDRAGTREKIIEDIRRSIESES